MGGLGHGPQGKAGAPERAGGLAVVGLWLGTFFLSCRATLRLIGEPDAQSRAGLRRPSLPVEPCGVTW